MNPNIDELLIDDYRERDMPRDLWMELMSQKYEADIAKDMAAFYGRMENAKFVGEYPTRTGVCLRVLNGGRG